MPQRESGIGRAFVPFLPVALALFCIQLDFFSLGLALPVIADDFGTTTTNLQWVLSGYLLALGSLVIPASRMADLIGRKRVFLTGIAVFGISSLLCGLSQSALMLELFRVVQGVGGAMIMPVSLALVSNATDAALRPRILGLMFGVANIGIAVGPLVGGGLAATVGWRWVFFVNVPITVVAFVMAARTLAESRDPGGHTIRQVDWMGLALIVVGVATLSLGIDAITGYGLLAVATLTALAVSAVAMTLFVRQERRAQWPLISRDLGKRRSFWVLLGGGAFANACNAALASAACGPISGRLAGKLPASRVMAVSIVLGGVGMVIQALAGNLAVDVLGLTLAGLAFGMGFTFTNVATQSVLPQQLASEASGVVLTALVALGGVAIVVAAIGLELFGGDTDMAAATTSMLLWTGVLAMVVGPVFGVTTRRMTSV